ncbi:MAG: type II toxin-antitoxin system VapC family toxin [Roseateles sp.]|uniref:type II toxin-antitoxin system VapC family toxin n=1 Tax=Roseateles sp. TaxID=1971397 RepID=UPI004035D98F
MKLLVDTSALFKRFVNEAGQEAVEAVIAQADSLLVAPHCRLELLSAAMRLRWEGRLEVAGWQSLCGEIDSSMQEVEVLPLTPSLERLAIRALEVAPLRAMDALHVAGAAMARVDLFVTADRRQAAAAKAFGLPTQLIEV